MFDMAKTVQRGLQWMTDQYPEVLMNLYPPYLGAGIRVDHISDDFRRVEVRMPLTVYNQNYVGTQFGGSLYAMCDPFYMLMLINNLGDEYIVWDKAAEVAFRRPGEGTVYATFEIDEGDLDEIRRGVDREGVVEPVFEVEVVDGQGEAVAEIVKTLHVRRKSK
jgi:acyl-coenzyme A thioesterase PaaI-like protein